MKMNQIVWTGTDLFGVDEFGQVYIYTTAREPLKHREPQFKIITRHEYEEYQNQMANAHLDRNGRISNKRDPGHSHQIMAAKQEEPWQQAYPVAIPAPLPPGYLAENKQAYLTTREMEAQKHYIEEQCIGSAVGCPSSGVVMHGNEFLQHTGYKDVFSDGCTEGWKPLNMAVSKPVPHKDDPTKCERS